ncbi:phosphopantetheine-binding protein [Paraliomyxa miuraensis]|uniref:phosphopantetheine-binding protein n=1 Tax=Paraliomyxa miuraensis TaxID=376150 RepID=UPI00225BFA60|nr:phosphopantetheine-binding protein [Paraliomyxa miuraensis]MCX4243034.1 phosphopantetheine-binding protein [Paraliomyxa miuraensis]
MSQTIEQIVSEFLQRRTAVARISRTEHLFETGIVNSLFLLELLSFLELRFDITVSMDDLDLEGFSTIERIASFVDEKRRGATRAAGEQPTQGR